MDEAKADSLDVAVTLFRPFFIQAILKYNEMVKEDGIEVANKHRSRWSKEDIMGRCQWPYPKDWKSLRERLERHVGLILYQKGVFLRGKKEAKVWTFATRVGDREYGIVRSILVQLGQMRRAADVTNRAISPGDERHALDDGSKERLARELMDKRAVTLKDVMASLTDVKQDLLTRDTRELLMEYNDTEEREGGLWDLGDF